MSLPKDKVFPFRFVGKDLDVSMDAHGKFFVNGETIDDPHKIIENLKMVGTFFYNEERNMTDKLKNEETSGYYGLYFTTEGREFRTVK